MLGINHHLFVDFGKKTVDYATQKSCFKLLHNPHFQRKKSIIFGSLKRTNFIKADSTRKQWKP